MHNHSMTSKLLAFLFMILMSTGISYGYGGGSSTTTSAPAPTGMNIAKGSVGTNGKMGVIFIHGWGNVFDNNTWPSDKLADLYWAYWTPKFEAKGLAVKKIKWDTKRRLDAQWQEIVNQFMSIYNGGHCANGCVVITHSTGGLIVDMMLARAQDSRGTANDYSRVWNETLVAVNLSSAAGGTEITQVLVDAIGVGCGLFSTILQPVFSMLIPGFDCNDPGSIGVTYDLIPTVARSMNRSDDTRTPELMVAGFGNIFGNIAKPFILGTSDGMAPMHSSCGSNQHKGVESCVSNMGPDGHYRTYNSYVSYNAPTGFYANHYPFIMTKEGHGGELAPGLADTDIFSTKTETIIDNKGLANFEVFETTSGVWLLKKYYKRIKGDTDHLSTLLVNHLTFL